MILPNTAWRAFVPLGALSLALAGCARHSELDCMERAMYFESNRSSRDGMVAVGSVVMNRAESGRYPGSVCGVVGQRGQFAPRIMSRRMPNDSKTREAAVSVLNGERHPLIGDAMFFHTAGYTFPYNNMHYVLVAGGNAFYEKRSPEAVTQNSPPPAVEGITGR